jgi:RNA polymerase sigma-70 factor (ECF subfamily)
MRGTVSKPLDDEALVVRLRDKDTEAFAALYDRHSRLAFGLAYRMLGEPSAAEDVVQDAFLSVWRQAGTFRPEKSAARTWILSIVHHRAVDHLRGAKGREVAGGAPDGTPERADDRVDVEHEAHLSLEGARVRTALRALPREQQQAIELAYFDGLSHSEIARELEVPVGTVKGRLRIGLQKMKAILDQAPLQRAARDTR